MKASQRYHLNLLAGILVTPARFSEPTLLQRVWVWTLES
jgi:hypothetical protein